jgi:hypothetical protein
LLHVAFLAPRIARLIFGKSVSPDKQGWSVSFLVTQPSCQDQTVKSEAPSPSTHHSVRQLVRSRSTIWQAQGQPTTSQTAGGTSIKSTRLPS